MAYFPLFINIEEKHVLVVGGGAIAERRIRTLLEFGCRITVVSPALTDGLKELAGKEQIRWIQELYKAEYVETDCWIFVLAAADAETNAAVVFDCKRNKVPVNNASDKNDCDFYFPGLIKEDNMVIGVTSGGSDHKAVADLSKKIRALVQKTWQA